CVVPAHVKRDLRARVRERAAEGARVDLAAARYALKVDLMDVEQAFPTVLRRATSAPPRRLRAGCRKPSASAAAGRAAGRARDANAARPSRRKGKRPA